jgi:hypothetical protein
MDDFRRSTVASLRVKAAKVVVLSQFFKVANHEINKLRRFNTQRRNESPLPPLLMTNDN